MDSAVADAAEGGCSITFVAIDVALAGLLAFRDEPRAEAAAVIAERLGLTDARAGVAPDMKATAIQELQAQQGSVAFVGGRR